MYEGATPSCPTDDRYASPNREGKLLPATLGAQALCCECESHRIDHHLTFHLTSLLPCDRF